MYKKIIIEEIITFLNLFVLLPNTVVWYNTLKCIRCNVESHNVLFFLHKRMYYLTNALIILNYLLILPLVFLICFRYDGFAL